MNPSDILPPTRCNRIGIRTGIRAVIAAVFVSVCALAAPDDIHFGSLGYLSAPGGLYPGSPLVVVSPEAESDGLRVRITGRAGIVAAASHGFIRETENGRFRYFFLALANTLPAGYYRVELTGSGPDGDFSVDRVFRLQSRDFPVQRLELDSALTDVRVANPAVRARESQTLGEILSNPNPDHWYLSGPFILPLEEIRRTTAYGARRTYIYSDGTTSSTIHLGWDYAGAVGTPVVSPGAGCVVFAGFRQVTGNTVVIEHLPGVFTLYYHLDSIAVAVDAVVAQADPIGTVGSTGLATGPHLHWEARVGLESFDPEPFIGIALVDTAAVFSYSDPDIIEERW